MTTRQAIVYVFIAIAFAIALYVLGRITILPTPMSGG